VWFHVKDKARRVSISHHHAALCALSRRTAETGRPSAAPACARRKQGEIPAPPRITRPPRGHSWGRVPLPRCFMLHVGERGWVALPRAHRGRRWSVEICGAQGGIGGTWHAGSDSNRGDSLRPANRMPPHGRIPPFPGPNLQSAEPFWPAQKGSAP
jgi:hypothetical protein